MKTSLTTTAGASARSALRRTSRAILVAGFLPTVLSAQTTFSWPQIKDKFEAA
jgi:hypothetical protein